MLISVSDQVFCRRCVEQWCWGWDVKPVNVCKKVKRGIYSDYENGVQIARDGCYDEGMAVVNALSGGTLFKLI